MTQKIFILLFGLVLSSSAMAQEWGLGIGIHQTTATISPLSSGGSVDGKLGFDVGVHLAFELVPNLRFRTGLLYDQRQFDFKNANGKTEFNFAYIDIPVNLQYNFTPMVSVFGGLIVGVKASDSTSAPSGIAGPNVDMNTLYPLLNAGVNFNFDEMVGFDLYYEAGLGEFATDSTTNVSLKNYSTFGLRFIYWL